MYIYDSSKQEKIKFTPIVNGEASIYVCGPTVYDDAHLGHARSALSFDLLSRTLTALGYKVTMAKNFTDIDDKIINKVKSSGKSIEEITSFYIDRYLSEMDKLGIKRADIEPKASESIDSITHMIQKLIDKGFAYIVSNGDVYFDTSKDKAYSSISGINTEIDDNQNRVEHNNEKRSPKDFALWKSKKADNEISYPSSFSDGRPGWHIECSAMIEEHFGHLKGHSEYSVDIHGGGADLLFPHHENEAAQSRCASGHEVAKYWMHNGFVQINGKKMAKSLGNSFFLKDALKVYDGEVIRYYLNSVHYRNDFNFAEVDLISSKKRLDKIYRLKKRVFNGKSSVDSSFRKDLLNAMEDDLNISEALAIIEDMVNDMNDKLDKNNKDKVVINTALGNIEFINELLGFGGRDPFVYFQIGVDEDLKVIIEELITQRSEAKERKDYALSDSIREQLNNVGVNLMDTPNGTVWEKVK